MAAGGDTWERRRARSSACAYERRCTIAGCQSSVRCAHSCSGNAEGASKQSSQLAKLASCHVCAVSRAQLRDTPATSKRLTPRWKQEGARPGARCARCDDDDDDERTTPTTTTAQRAPAGGSQKRDGTVRKGHPVVAQKKGEEGKHHA